MAEVRLMEGESAESGYNRFKRRVAKEGTLSLFTKRSEFVSRSERRRLKSRKARKRQRRIEKKIRQMDKPEDFKDYTFIDDDIASGWPIELSPVPYTGPTTHVCVIARHTISNVSGVLLIKDKGKAKYGFPGGGLKVGEKPESGAVRETNEETGFEIRRPTDDDIVFDILIGDHRFVCFVSEVIGGEPAMGEDVERLILKDVGALKQMVDQGGLLPNHMAAFLKFYELNAGQEATCIA